MERYTEWIGSHGSGLPGKDCYTKLAKYEDLEEIFRSKMTDAACEFLSDKEEFAKWLDRNKWIAKKCDEYARAEEQGKLLKRNDLISRSAAIEEFYKRIGGDLDADEVHYIEKVINSLPTAYDFDEVIKQLEYQKNQYLRRKEEIENKLGESQESRRMFSKACSYDYSIEIVKSGVK